MCFATPPAPQAPQAAPPPPPAVTEGQSEQSKMLRQQLKSRSRRGVSSTLLTSPLQSSAVNVNKPTLIGG